MRHRGAGPASIMVCSTLALALLAFQPGRAPASQRHAADRPGRLWSGEPGISEKVSDIMARAATAAPSHALPGQRVAPPGAGREAIGHDPRSPRVAVWPAPSGERIASGPEPAARRLPQPIQFGFDAITLTESTFVPPDPGGAVGPTQILVAANGRIKVFDRAGVAGALDVDLDTFFASVRAFQRTSQPHVEYDRLSGRWFVTCITSAFPNRVLIAVSGGATILDASSFTFFFFQQDLVSPAGQTGLRIRDMSLGVDRFALYIGGNVFSLSDAFNGSTGFVVNKASLIGGGPILARAFRGLGTTASGGLWAPRGVSNDDPAATQGYFIGVDTRLFGRLDLRRVSDPGGSPTISGNVALTVPDTFTPINVGAAEVTFFPLDALDDRLFAARIKIDKTTGIPSLWTAHNVAVDTTGAASPGGDRDGARWYEIRDLGGTPTLAQSGTLFDPTPDDPRSFFIPSVAMSGQGHMVLGASTAGTLYYADATAAGRLSSDPIGTIQDATLLTASATPYDDGVNFIQPWGGYSTTLVDPNDDMTFWTFQEWCDATNSWGVQVSELQAPPPASPTSAGSVCRGVASAAVTVTGTSTGGSAFFDPGPDTGGPGFAGHIGANVGGGVTVNAVTVDSATQVTLDVSTTAAVAGAHDVAIVNPDGQSATGAGILTVFPGAPAPLASNNGPACAGGAVQLSATPAAGTPSGTITYAWTGPNGYASAQQNPILSGVGSAQAGLYSVTLAVGGCVSQSATTLVRVIADGGACAACGVCVAGACASGDSDGDGVGDGCDCAPGDSGAWDIPGEAHHLELTHAPVGAGGTTTLQWLAPATGGLPAAMSYDVIRTGTPGDYVTAATCLESDDGTDTTAVDTDVPASNHYFFYVVRAQNSCGAGVARRNSAGTPLPARDCP